MATVANLQVLIGAKTTGFQKAITDVQKTFRQKFSGNAIKISDSVLTGITGLSAALAGGNAV